MLPALPRPRKYSEVSEFGGCEISSVNARRWYMDPYRLPIAKEHDRPVERRYAEFCTTLITNFVETNEELNVWDIGCGEGLLAEHLEEHYPNLRYTVLLQSWCSRKIDVK